MNKYELIESVYFNMKREGYKSEQIVHINDKFNKDIEKIVIEFSSKITKFNGKHISQEQIDFAKEVSTILYNDLIDEHKTVVVPAKPGFGKSVIIKLAVKTMVQKSLVFGNARGVIIVSDKYNNLGEYQNEFGKLAYLMDRRDGEPIQTQLEAQRKCPIVIITSTLFKILGENLSVFKKFTHPQHDTACERDILIIDEKPLLLDSERIDQKFISDIKNNINQFPIAAFSDTNQKDILRNLLHEMDSTFQQLISQYKDDDFFIHKPTDKITSDDETLFKLIKNLDFNIQNKMQHIKRFMLEEGALWYNKNYNFINQQFFRTIGLHNYSEQFKTIIFDGTADIDLEYCNEEKFIFLDVTNNAKYSHVSVYNYSELNFSRGTLVERRGNNKTMKCFVEWMNNHFKDKECKIYLTTFKDATAGLTKILMEPKYKDLIQKIVLNEKGKVASYGATKGQNMWQGCNVAIMLGKYIQSEDIYTATAISHLWAQFFKEGEAKRITELFNFEDGKYKGERLNFFRLTKIMVDLEQDLFRCAIRNYNETAPIEIYTFGLDKTGTRYLDDDMGQVLWTDLYGRLRYRLKGCKAKNITDVPEELDKVFNYGNGNSTIAQLIKWVAAYDGEPILVDEFKRKFELSESYWKKLFRTNVKDRSILQFQKAWTEKNIQRKVNEKFGKGKWIYI